MQTNARTQDGLIGDSPASLSVADALLWNVLPHLQLNIAQTAVLCGISVRQLGYWSKQGYVAASGRGARRMYGLDALRRILAINSAMANGMSLRQALRTLSSQDADSSPGFPTSPETDAAPITPTPERVLPLLPPLSPTEVGALAGDLRALFDANRFTRDSASGLAVKVGRATADIRRVAENLCTNGVLTKTVSQDEIVFESALKDRR